MSKRLALLLVTGILITSTNSSIAQSNKPNLQDQDALPSTSPAKTATLLSVYVASIGSANTMVVGSTLQFIAYGVYSNGSVVELPESETMPVILWNTSDHAVARISRLGHATALAKGSVVIEATVANITAKPWAVTVDVSTGAPPIVGCSATPSVITPGETSVITAVATATEQLPLIYQFNASAGSVSAASSQATLTAPAAFAGLITVTCDVDQQGGGSASATTNVLVATSSGDLDGAVDWEAVHDTATAGDSSGSSVYPATAPPYDNARKFYVAYSDHGGERFSMSFGKSTSPTHFVYDTYVYLVDPLNVQNVEMDINQVMANGDTVIFGTQCSGSSGTWEYTIDITVDGKRVPHWVPSNVACNPMKWSANSWHHVQIASSRDMSGNVTYDWVTFDGETSTFVNAAGRSALSLGWEVGDLSLNFQLDGSSKSSESITAYVDKLTIYRW